MGNRGFTLIELLVAALVALMLVVALGALFVTSQRVANRSESQSFLQRQGALIMDQMTQRIRSASVLSVASCNADPNSIGVTTTLVDADGVARGPFCFYRSGSQLLMDNNAGTRNLLSGAATSLTVTNFTTFTPPGTPTIVSFQFQLSDNRSNSMTFRSDVARRNGG